VKLLALVVLVGCGTVPPSWAPDAGDCVAYAPPPGTDLTAPTVSFKTDVMAVLTGHCSSSICHGISDGAQGGLFLGAETMKGADSATVFTNLMAKSGQASDLPYVTPSSDANSYIMHKLDGDQCMVADKCSGNDCERTMPFDGQLPPETRDIVRRWIAQGAPNN
jgi:hypothetical protein